MTAIVAPTRKRTTKPTRKHHKTQCPHGHRYTPENSYYWSGVRHCRTCTQQRAAERRYGLTVSQYDALLQAQNGVCAICNEAPQPPTYKLFVDHDHKCCPKDQACGKCLRGLLCRKCNLALGQLEDDLTRLRAAIQYLENHKEKQS